MQQIEASKFNNARQAITNEENNLCRHFVCCLRRERRGGKEEEKKRKKTERDETKRDGNLAPAGLA